MREIKFRAWHPTSGMKFFNLSHVDAGSVLFDDGDWRPLYDRTCEIMQYTGLRDKNGKEIYEGDILGWGDVKCSVFWSYELSCFMTKQIEPGGVVDNYLYTCPQYEVSGNIYENPDLIGDTDARLSK